MWSEDFKDMKTAEEPTATIAVNAEPPTRPEALHALSFQRKESTRQGPVLKKESVDWDCGIWYAYTL